MNIEDLINDDVLVEKLVTDHYLKNKLEFLRKEKQNDVNKVMRELQDKLVEAHNTISPLGYKFVFQHARMVDVVDTRGNIKFIAENPFIYYEDDRC